MNLDAFKAVCSTVGYTPKGMFFSELFLFLECCRARSVDLVIESGVKHGVSTRVLNAAFRGRVVSVDREFAIEPPPNATFIRGDADVVIPQLLENAGHHRVAVLLDGPKGEDARALKDRCLQHPAVALVAIHDEPHRAGEDLHSHEGTFRMAVGTELDALITDAYAEKYPNGPGLALWWGTR